MSSWVSLPPGFWGPSRFSASGLTAFVVKGFAQDDNPYPKARAASGAKAPLFCSPPVAAKAATPEIHCVFRNHLPQSLKLPLRVHGGGLLGWNTTGLQGAFLPAYGL
jgi:hypothetical protein